MIDLEKATQSLTHWQIQDGVLVLEHKFSSFLQAIEFINQMANLSEEQNHHAEIINCYNRVSLKLISHDVGAITERDIRLAKDIEKLI